MTEEPTADEKILFWMREAKEARADRDRLRALLDCRPAMNAVLAEAYVDWTGLVYQSDAAFAGYGQAEAH